MIRTLLDIDIFNALKEVVSFTVLLLYLVRFIFYFFDHSSTNNRDLIDQPWSMWAYIDTFINRGSHGR